MLSENVQHIMLLKQTSPHVNIISNLFINTYIPSFGEILFYQFWGSYFFSKAG